MLDFIFVGNGRFILLGLVTAVALSACSGSSGSPTTAPPTTPSTSPAVAPVDALEQLAGLAAKANYQATYMVRQQHPVSTAKWLVWRNGSSLRVDVVAGAQTATLIVTARATYGCRRTAKTRTCLRFAGAGKPVPSGLALLAQRVFSSDIARLTTASNGYTVTTASPTAAGGSVPGATCFAVMTSSGASKDPLAGTYCFSSVGVLTSITYPTGNTVQLQTLIAGAPAAGVFRPYSSPTPLPHS